MPVNDRDRESLRKTFGELMNRDCGYSYLAMQMPPDNSKLLRNFCVSEVIVGSEGQGALSLALQRELLASREACSFAAVSDRLVIAGPYSVGDKAPLFTSQGFIPVQKDYDPMQGPDYELLRNSSMLGLYLASA